MQPVQQEKKRGALTAPLGCALPRRQRLERELRDDRAGARAAAKRGLYIVKGYIPRSGKVPVRRCRAARAPRKHVVDPKPQTRIGSRNVLGMIEQVTELRPEPECEPLGEVQVLVDSEVDVVGGCRHQGVTASVGQGSFARLDVLGVRIVGQISDNISCIGTSGGRQASNTAPRSGYTSGIEDRSIASGLSL